MKLKLYVISGVAAARSFDLRPGSTVIGRDQAADIQIPSKEISRKHARIDVGASDVTIQDLQSSNGTIVNGKVITEKKIKHKDQIILGDVILELRNEDLPEITAMEVGKTIYKQATKVMTERLKPKNLWPYFSLFFALMFVLMSWITHASYKGLMKDQLEEQVLLNAQNLVRYMAEKNRQDMQLQSFPLLDVEAVLAQPGVVTARIIGNNGRVLAPLKSMDQTDQGPFVMEALNHNSNELMAPSPQNPQGHHILVHPIRVYDDRQAKYVTLGVAKIEFNTTTAIGPLSQTKQLLYIMLVASILISIFLGWLISKTLSQPILLLAEKIQRWRTGQIYDPDDAPFQDWDPLYKAVERAIEDVQNDPSDP